MKANKKINAKLVMLKHSKAKVELYTNYLATYLNILSRVNFISKIHLYDLMCGEGTYEDGSEGSPIVAMKKIKEHYFSNKKSSPNMEVWFNDKDKSEIENDKYKIERVQEACSKIYCPDNVNVKYTSEDYTKIFPKLLQKINSLTNERLLLFIDPYGYKEVKLEHLKRLLTNGKAEILLFLPISFMSRVAGKALSKEEFPGGKPLQNFLTPLFELDEKIICSTKPYGFIEQLKYLLKIYLHDKNVFVDTFTIQRDEQNVYCLFFFTSHIRGFEKMLETKWKLDEQHGKGFRFDSEQESFFTELEMSNYPKKLRAFIQSKKNITNSDVYLFGLENGFLPKHTNQILKDWQNNNPRFKVYLIDGNKARKNSFYILYENYGANPKKIVKFVFE